jgi:shikimate kinase
MIVYLIGYMGSGKTTVGKKLSRVLAYDFLDLDQQIENVIGQSIAEFFEQNGEESFREIERKELHKTFQLQNTVVSLGGGTPCFFDNLDHINQHGKSVYLKLSAVSLASRLQQSKTPRPLIKDLSDGELFEFVQQQLGERERFYNRTHLLIKGENLKVHELASMLKELE